MQLGKVSALELTRMLKAWSDGDASTLERLTLVVYAELRRLARSSFADGREGHLLQPSARLMGKIFIDFEVRYFGGVENGEVAWILGVSEPTVAWLYERPR